MRPRLIKLKTLETIYKENNNQISKVFIKENNVFFNILIIFMLIFGGIFLYYRYLINLEKRIKEENEIRRNEEILKKKEEYINNKKISYQMGPPPPIVEEKRYKSNNIVSEYERVVNDRRFNQQSQQSPQPSSNIMLNDIRQFKSFNQEYI